MSTTLSPRRAGRPSDARERILTAAIDSLRGLDTAQLLAAAGVREIARLAGVGTSSLYHHVGSMSGLAHAVVERLFDAGPDLTPSLPATVEIADVAFPLDAALAVHVSDLNRFSQELDFRPRMGAWAFGGTEAATAYRTRLRTIDERFAPGLAHLYGSWGREPRPPFDTASIMTSLVALVIGTVTREQIDPAPARREQFPLASLAISTTLLRQAGDHRDVDVQLADLNHYPRDLDPTSRGRRGEVTRTRVLFAAAELFRLQGYEATTMTQIARRAGLTPRTVHLHAGDKSQLALTLVRAEATDRLPEPSAASTSDALREHLVAVARFAADRRRYLEPYLTDLAMGAQAQDVLVDRMSALLAALRPDEDLVACIEDAVTAVLALGQRVLRDPTASPETIASAVAPLLDRSDQ